MQGDMWGSAGHGEHVERHKPFLQTRDVQGSCLCVTAEPLHSCGLEQVPAFIPNLSSSSQCGQSLAEHTQPGWLQLEGTAAPLRCSLSTSWCRVKLPHLGSSSKMGMVLLLLDKECVLLEELLALDF